jgi:hypothetical protein
MDNLIESSPAPRPRLEDAVIDAFREDAPFTYSKRKSVRSRFSSTIHLSRPSRPW